MPPEAPNSEKHRNGNALRTFKRYVKTGNSRDPQHTNVCRRHQISHIIGKYEQILRHTMRHTLRKNKL